MKIFRTCHRHMSRPKELCLNWGPVVAIAHVHHQPITVHVAGVVLEFSGETWQCWWLGEAFSVPESPIQDVFLIIAFVKYTLPNILWKWHEGQWISNCFNTNYDRGVGDLEPQMTFMPSGNEMSLWYTDKFRFRMRSLTEPSGCFLSCP